MFLLKTHRKLECLIKRNFVPPRRALTNPLPAHLRRAENRGWSRKKDRYTYTTYTREIFTPHGCMCHCVIGGAVDGKSSSNWSNLICTRHRGSVRKNSNKKTTRGVQLRLFVRACVCVQAIKRNKTVTMHKRNRWRQCVRL